MPENNNVFLNKVIKNSDGVPVTLTKIFYKDFEKDGTNELGNFINETFEVNLDNQTASTLYDMQSKYEKHKENSFISRQILVANSKLIKGVIGLASAPAAATGIGAIAVGGVNLFMDKLLDYALDEFDESVKKSSSRIVGIHLREVRAQTGKTLEEISGMSTEEAHKILFKSNIGIMDNSIDFLSPDEKTKALHEMTKILEDKLVHASALNKLVNEAQDFEIGSIKNEVAFISKVQANQQQCLLDINNNIESLGANMNLLSNSVNILHSEVKTNSENVGILKNYIFSNADVKGKIELLRSGILDNDLDKKKKDALEKQLKAVEAKQNVQNDIKNYLNKAQHITTILSNVGFDSDTVEKANELISLGSTAMNAFAAYSSGNVLGTVSIVSGFFGGKSKSDPATQRHKQIMEKLGIIDEKLDEVLERQLMLLKGQQHILESLSKISRQIDELHGIEMEMLEEIKTETLYNRLSNVNLHTRKLRVLESFSKPFVQFKLKKSRTYDDIIQYYKDNGDLFEPHNQIFNDLLSLNSPTLDEFMKLKNYEVLGIQDGSSTNIISELIKGFDEIIKYVENHMSNSEVISKNSFVAMRDIYDLGEKISIVQKDNLQDEYSNYWHLIKSSLIITKNLERVYDVLKEVHIFYLLQKDKDSESELLSKNEFFSEQFHKRYGLRHFKNLLTLVNIAIIQQNLLSGDILLERFYSRLFDDNIEISQIQKDKEEFLQIIKVLNTNKLLKNNFSKYFVKKQLEKKRVANNNGTNDVFQFDFFEYSLFLSDTSTVAQDISNSRTNLRLCFDQPLRSKIIFHNEHWKMDLYRDDKDAYMKLPDSKSFNQGELRYKRELFELINLKHRIMDKISEYELKDYIENSKNIYQHLKFN